MKTKILLLFLIIGIQGVNALTTTPTFLNVEQMVGTTQTYDFVIDNPTNISDSISCTILGGTIVDWSILSPPNIINPNFKTLISESITIHLMVTIPSDTPDSMQSGTLYISSSSPISIPINIHAKTSTTTSTTTTTIPDTNKQLELAIFGNGIIEPNKRIFFLVTDASNDQPISYGLIKVNVGDTPIDIAISNGFAQLDVPSTVTCPALVMVSVSGYSMLTTVFESPQCKESSGGSTPGTSGRLKFIPSGITRTVQQFITSDVVYQLKNGLNCELDITGGTFTSGTTITQEGEKPVRVANLPHDTLPPGGKMLVTFTIDTYDVPTGAYVPVFTVNGEDANGNDISATFQFNLNVIKGINPDTNETEEEEEEDQDLEVNLYDATGVGDEARAKVRFDGDPITGAILKIEFPDGDISRFLTPMDGEIKFMVTQVGRYELTATKEGYTTGIHNFTIGGRSLIIETTDVGLGDTMKVTIKSDTENIPGAMVTINFPDASEFIYASSSNGEVTFVVSQEGTYNISVSKVGYDDTTKQVTIAPKILTITQSGDAGIGLELILIIKSDDTAMENAKVSVVYPDGSTTNYFSSSGGEAKFTIYDPGSYVVTATKSGHSPVEQTITIEQKELTISTEGETTLGNNIILFTTSGGVAVEGVSIEVTLPDNTLKTLTSTSSTGKSSLELTQSGHWSVSAKKENYNDAHMEFDVSNKVMSLDMTYTDSQGMETASPMCGGRLSVRTLDKDGGIITSSIIKLILPDSRIVSIFPSILTSEGTYSITATAIGYEDVSTTLVVVCPTSALVTPPHNISPGESMVARASIKGSGVLICDGVPMQINSDNAGNINYPIATAGNCILKWGGSDYPFTVSGNSFDWSQLLFAIIVLIVVVLVILGASKLKKSRGGGTSGATEDEQHTNAILAAG